MKALQADHFWQVSGELYASPGVAELCLQLQDRFELNVNLLLLCSYLQAQNVELPAQQIQSLIAANCNLAKATHEIRLKRRKIDKQDSRYQIALQQELRMEKRQQAALIACVQSFSQTIHKKTNNRPTVNSNRPDNLLEYAQQETNSQSNELISALIRLQQLISHSLQKS